MGVAYGLLPGGSPNRGLEQRYPVFPGARLHVYYRDVLIHYYGKNCLVFKIVDVGFFFHRDNKNDLVDNNQRYWGDC